MQLVLVYNINFMNKPGTIRFYSDCRSHKVKTRIVVIYTIQCHPRIVLESSTTNVILADEFFHNKQKEFAVINS